MRPVTELCTLREGALKIQVGNQIEDLEKDIKETDARQFFDSTFITDGLKTLVSKGMARLFGDDPGAGVVLKQALGGGKTHLMKCLALLAVNPTLRREVIPDVPYSDCDKGACVAAFNGRNYPNHFFWGEIARQLGHEKLFAEFWQDGPKAPGSNHWVDLFQAVDAPILILMDELPPYIGNYKNHQMGTGTVADVISTALTNLMDATRQVKNVFVVMSTLEGTHKIGAEALINAINDGEKRFLMPITPVSLEGGEIYGIIRKRLFKTLPDEGQMEEIIREFSQNLNEGIQAGTLGQESRADAEALRRTYPFHPSYDRITALFKNNETFQQTRGLLALTSRLLKSVWEGCHKGAVVMGAQHFDFSLTSVREEIRIITSNEEALSSDIWREDKTAFAMQIDKSVGNHVCSQVATMVYMSSAGENAGENVVRGLTRQEICQFLTVPGISVANIREAVEALQKQAWYLHTDNNKFFFDRNENLIKRLSTAAQNADKERIQGMIEEELMSTFAPSTKIPYAKVLCFKNVEEIMQAAQRERVLYVALSQDGVRGAEVLKRFDALHEKNNLLLLHAEGGGVTQLDQSTRRYYAARSVDAAMPDKNPLKNELQDKKEEARQDWGAMIEATFDHLYFFRGNGQVGDKVLGRDKKSGEDRIQSGEDRIQQALESAPARLFDVEQNFDMLRERAEENLFNQGSPIISKDELRRRSYSNVNMPLLPAKNGLETLMRLAFQRGRWEDLGDGRLSKQPRPKQTGITWEEVSLDQDGKIRLTLSPVNGGPSPEIHYQEEASAENPVSAESPLLTDPYLVTSALRVSFLVIDPSGNNETGEVNTWENKLKLRANKLAGSDCVELNVTPRGTIRYTLDGTEPREGIVYAEPIQLPAGVDRILAFAECEGLETRQQFKFNAEGAPHVELIPGKPARFKGKGRTSSQKPFGEIIAQAADKHISFIGVVLSLGKEGASIFLNANDNVVNAGQLEAYAQLLGQPSPDVEPVLAVDAPPSFRFMSCCASRWDELKEFLAQVGIDYCLDEISQDE